MKQNNKWKYQGDGRYEKVYEKMQLLGIQDITTDRQHKNGTVVWKLPIKNEYSKLCIEVASFASGYVRNQGVSCHSNYQLNKRCQGEPEYFKLSNGDYRKFETRSCVLIPIEIDRLEYLISYCLKNYYIKNANQVADGKYVPEWYHNDKLESDVFTQKQRGDGYKEGCKHKKQYIKDLENKLATINRIADI